MATPPQAVDDPPDYQPPEDDTDEYNGPRWWMDAIASGLYDWDGDTYDGPGIQP